LGIPVRRENELLGWHRSNWLSQRLATIPGVGAISANAFAAAVNEPERFRSGRRPRLRWVSRRFRAAPEARN
jgi:transposase